MALLAQDAVPNNDPVIPWFTVNEPVIVCEPFNVSVRSDCKSNNVAEPELTWNNEPDNVSFTVNNGPVDPLIDNTVEPELYIDTLPVTPNDPVICADPVYGNAATDPSKYDAVNAYDAVTDLDADTALSTYDAVCAFATYDAVCAVVTNDAVNVFSAHDAVPNNEPVIPCVTVNEPEMIADPLTSSRAFGDVVPIPTLPLLLNDSILVSGVEDSPCDSEMSSWVLEFVPTFSHLDIPKLAALL